MLVSNQWVKEEMKREIKKYLETHENGNTAYPNWWDSTKLCLRGNLITIKMLSEINQSDKDNYHMLSLIWGT